MTTTTHISPRRWPVAITAILVAIISVISFGMSFVAMRDLMERAGFPGEVAWGLPVIVDGTIVAAMVYLFARRGEARGDRAVPWVLLVAFAVISVICNGVHTSVIFSAAQGIPLAFAIFLGTLPPVALLGSSELLVRLLTPSRAMDVPETVIDVEGGETATQSQAIDVAAPRAVAETVAAPVAAVLAPSNEDVATGEADGEVAIASGETVAGPIATVATAPDLIASDSPAQIADGDEPIAGGEQTGDDRIQLHVLEPVGELPTEPAEQISWVIERAKAGDDVTWRAIANLLELSDRQAQRRVTAARQQEPSAFAA